MIDTLFVLFATKDAVNAKTIDLIIIAGSHAIAGIPNANELISGDNTAVIRPTFKPYL